MALTRAERAATWKTVSGWCRLCWWKEEDAEVIAWMPDERIERMLQQKHNKARRDCRGKVRLVKPDAVGATVSGVRQDAEPD